MSGLLEGRRVLVVGGGQQDYGQPDPPLGIGRAICLRSAKEGARVAVLDRDEPAARSTVAHIEVGGGEAIALSGDAADDNDSARAITAAVDQLGGLDGLVLNVGVAGGAGLMGTSSETWDLVFAINVRAHFLAAKHALPHMSDGGAIVFVSSTAALQPSTNDLPAYIASKAALDGLSRFVAREGAPRGIRSNVVMPGLIDTSLGRLASQIKPDRDAIAIPAGRHGTAEEVAHAVVFLLSSRASYVSAQTLAVDGGLTGAA